LLTPGEVVQSEAFQVPEELCGMTDLPLIDITAEEPEEAEGEEPPAPTKNPVVVETGTNLGVRLVSLFCWLRGR
jgi:hypothetical protein